MTDRLNCKQQVSETHDALVAFENFSVNSGKKNLNSHKKITKRTAKQIYREENQDLLDQM
jgi:hypothetical protein